MFSGECFGFASALRCSRKEPYFYRLPLQGNASAEAEGWTALARRTGNDGYIYDLPILGNASEGWGPNPLYY